MSSPTYLLYLAAVGLLIVTPGPTMLMTLANAVNHGPARALVSSAGALTASLGAMALSALGLGAVLAASEAAFTVLKVLGAAYLVWLGIKTFRGGDALSLGSAAPAPAHRSLFMQGLLVGASNPKSLLFFAAFFPQFIDPAAPVLPQFALLSFTFVAGDFLMLVACALGVGRFAGWLRQAGVVRWINRVCGSLFALMGALLLLSRRNA
ncbi:LysE family translocator [Ramlibacter sp. Leaf400]|uniref:LysE family translocator n=1 Tax=Ramlibacter sp. Leaf400 TaxID=1736365 RepID=UPI0006F21253|nr:LysE family transporter [Ramlibacter sp. Leaf400]KQT11003.1 lysine transporter LysE [Ramlibacter sp. Leaf400]